VDGGPVLVVPFCGMPDDAPSDTPDPATRWGLWVRGRLRTTIVLGDDTGGHVADLSLHGWPRRRRRLLAATDEHDWTVTVEPGRVRVDRDGDRRMTVDGDEVELDGRRFAWPAYDGGIHRGPFQDAERVVADVAPAAGGEDEPVAVLAVAGELTDPLPVVLALCAVQLITRPRGSMADGIDPGAGFDIATPF
jgi:hypothetical protein